MTKEEFLKLTGIRQMSDPDYEKVEHAYMSVPDMDKLCNSLIIKEFTQFFRVTYSFLHNLTVKNIKK